MEKAQLAVVVGTLHVLRRADLAAIRAALARADRCLVRLAGAHLPRSPRHPFTWRERAAVIREALEPAERERVAFAPLREWWDAARTTDDVVQSATPADQVCVCRLDGPAFDPPLSWSPLEAPAGDALPAPALQEALLLADDPAAALRAAAPQLQPASAIALDAWLGTPAYRRLRAEAAQIAREQRAWSVAPYPVVLVTVDAVVRCAGHVLLIRRGRQPGQGLRALPGGFLDPSERTLDAAVRELVEETAIEDGPRTVRDALRASHVFDHPHRSQRNRVVTHGFHFDLGERPLPPVRGGDDAAAAEWVPLDALPGLEAQFLDDHFLILEHFLGPLPRLADPPLLDLG